MTKHIDAANRSGRGNAARGDARVALWWMPRPARIAGALVAASLGALAACSGGDDTPTDPGESVTLKYFSGPLACADLASHVRDAAESMMLAQFDQQSGEFAVGTPVPVASPSPTAPGTSGDGASSDAGAPESGDRFSETTLRTAGVDEPDSMKNDGARLFSLRRDADRLVLTRVGLRPAAAMRVQARTEWALTAPDEIAGGLFLVDETRLVALSTGGNAFVPMPMPMPVPLASAASMSPVCSEFGCGGVVASPPWVRLRLVDAAAGDLATTWSLRLPGRLIGARRIGEKVHVATQSDLRLPDGVRFYPDTTTGPTTDYKASIEGLKAANLELIRQAPPAHWLEQLRADGDGAATAPAAEDCATFARTEAATKLGWLRISTVDLATRTVTHQTVLAHASGLYVSARSMILTTPEWLRRGNGNASTLLHRFAFDVQGNARHDASGRFDGLLLNDYAIDERGDGVIRIVAMQSGTSGTWTTLESLGRVPSDTGGASTPVSGDTRGAAAARLETLGRSGPIARGETLRSARFIGDRVYFVTFRSVDPFFVYDLADPARPIALGELKIPGFSTWLQPVGPDHLLGIGYDSGGWPRRIKASLFDVSNPGTPREQAVLALGDSYTSSEALWDPHAFTWLPAADPADGGTMAIPVRSYAYGPYGTRDESGIRVVSVGPRSPSASLVLKGTLDMSDLLAPAGGAGASIDFGWRSTDPRRALFIDETVYGVADHAVRAAPLEQPQSTLGTLLLP